MGADTFITLTRGDNVDSAFQSARDQAQYEYGHGGYTGTIAEKGGFVVAQTTPMTVPAAKALARDLLDRDDPRVRDKRGDCVAIPVVHPTRQVEVRIPQVTYPLGRDHVAHGKNRDSALTDAATQVLRAQRGLRRGETVATVYPYMYDSRRSSGGNGAMEDVHARVDIARPQAALTPARVADTAPDGWLFVGTAPC